MKEYTVHFSVADEQEEQITMLCKRWIACGEYPKTNEEMFEFIMTLGSIHKINNEIEFMGSMIDNIENEAINK